MTQKLNGKKVAILATDGFEQVELLKPLEALRKEGAEVEVISPKPGDIQGFDHLKPDKKVHVDITLDSAKPDDYDAIVLPGGANNPDQLRTRPEVQKFVRAFADAGKPMAAICHAPWILIDAGLAKNRRLTSWPTIRQDLRNAGADVVDQEVVVDQGLITSRGPDDLAAFCAKLVEEIAEGRHHGQAMKARASEQTARR
ncbi:MAG TPA: type 1 glutamine amidotransferase domain-containing protein [Rhizomicrobium sp.]|jgi:protease I|nr:type 1 glutamine amidotransferase domain-containing protein [Rhizomicrobium sp.]